MAGASAMHVLKGFAKSAAIQQNGDSNVILNRYLQQLCTAIRRANARATLRRFSQEDGPIGVQQRALAPATEMEMDP